MIYVSFGRSLFGGRVPLCTQLSAKLHGSLAPAEISYTRRARFMMNGILMTNGIDALSIPAIRAAEFNSRMVDFYTSRDATEMMAFVLDCHPEVSQIRQLNPGLSSVRGLPDIQYHSLSDSVKQRI